MASLSSLLERSLNLTTHQGPTPLEHTPSPSGSAQVPVSAVPFAEQRQDEIFTDFAPYPRTQPASSIRAPSPTATERTSSSRAHDISGKRTFVEGVLKDLGTFNGEPHMTKIRTFIDKVDLVVKHEMVPPELLVDFVSTKFTGWAHTWWAGLPPARRAAISSWDTYYDPLTGQEINGLKSAIVARFAPKNHSRDTLRRLRELRPKGTQMDEFISHFNLLAYSLPPMPDYVLQDYFLGALPADLAGLVQATEQNQDSLESLQSATARIAATTIRKAESGARAAGAQAEKGTKKKKSSNQPGQSNNDKSKGKEKETTHTNEPIKSSVNTAADATPRRTACRLKGP